MWASRDVSPEGLPRTARHTALRLPPAGPSGLLAASRGGGSGGGALERGDRRVPGLLGGGNALLRRVEVLLQAGAQALLGVQGGLCPSVVKLGGLPRVALLAELALKRGVLGSGVLLDAVGPVNGSLDARVGLLGAPLGGRGLLLGPLGVTTRSLRLLLCGDAGAVALTRVLKRLVTLELGLACTRDGFRSLLLGLRSLRRGALSLVSGVAGRGLGRHLGRGGRLGAHDRVLRRALGLLGASLRLARCGLRGCSRSASSRACCSAFSTARSAASAASSASIRSRRVAACCWAAWLTSACVSARTAASSASSCSVSVKTPITSRVRSRSADVRWRSPDSLPASARKLIAARLTGRSPPSRSASPSSPSPAAARRRRSLNAVCALCPSSSQ